MDPVEDTGLDARPTYMHDLPMVWPHCAMLYFRDYNQHTARQFSCPTFGQKQDSLLLMVISAGI